MSSPRWFWSQTYLPLSYILALLVYAGSAHGGVLLSSLERTIFIETRILSSNATKGVAKAGVDSLVVQWGLDTDLDPSVDDAYVDVKLKFCYAPESQKDRGWRKTHDDLDKDKTCQVDICSDVWYAAVGLGSVWPLGKDIPGGTYFARIYALDANGKEVGYGQTTDGNKTTNLITIIPYSGRTATVDVAATICAAISLGTLLAFLTFETLNRGNTTMNRRGAE